MDPNNQNQDQNQIPPPPQPGQQSAPPPPPPPNQQPAEDEVPDYLKGADSTPAPGQAMHPPGGYQAKPGEFVQRSAAGGAVIENRGQDGSQRTSVYVPPSVPQPSQQTQPLDNTPTSYQPQFSQAPAYQPSAQPTGRNYKMLFLGLFILVIVGAAALIFMTGNSGSDTGNSDLDTQLQNDVNIIQAAIENYAIQKNEYPQLLPAVMFELSTDFLEDDFVNPITSEPYVLVSEAPAEGEVQYVLGGQCNAEGGIAQTGLTEAYALLTYLTDGSVYCLDKQVEPAPQS